MFGRKIPLFSLSGFKVSVDLSWFLLVILIVWSLAKGLFPYYFEGFTPSVYWWMGIGGAAGLFVSIVFHEFCHSIVARRFGLQMKGITLFVFGGVAEMETEPENAKSELLMAIAGPISSVFLGGFFFLALLAAKSLNTPSAFNAVLIYLGWLNFVLAGFNMIPAFPLDGGRVLRATLWAIKDNIRWATRVASRIGSGFGIVLIILGIFAFISGNFIGGLWYLLIGTFIRTASQGSYRQLIVKNILSGENIHLFMKTDPVVVRGSTNVQSLVDDYFYHYHYKMFPVLDDGLLTGCVTSKQARDVPRENWSNVTVSEIIVPCSQANSIPSNTDALEALTVMNRTGNSRLMVVDQGKLEGVVTLKDMLRFLALKMDLEGDNDSHRLSAKLNRQLDD